VPVYGIAPAVRSSRVRCPPWPPAPAESVQLPVAGPLTRTGPRHDRSWNATPRTPDPRYRRAPSYIYVPPGWFLSRRPLGKHWRSSRGIDLQVVLTSYMAQCQHFMPGSTK
jgi:hypothetical protein